MKEVGTPDVCTDARLNEAVWAKGVRNVPSRIRVPLSRKRDEDEYLGRLCTCHHFQKSTVNVDDN